jgi:hypothetical protein
MATRSFISIKTGKEFRTIYCHYDGYIKGNGWMLLTHYNTAERVEALLALGALSSISPKIAPDAGTTHSFFKPQDGVVLAYHRDRGDKFIPPRRHSYKNLEIEDYNYVFNSTTKTWFVKRYNGKWQPLKKVIAALQA